MKNATQPRPTIVRIRKKYPCRSALLGYESGMWSSRKTTIELHIVDTATQQQGQVLEHTHTHSKPIALVNERHQSYP